MTFISKKAFALPKRLKAKSSYLDKVLGKKQKIIDDYIDRDKAQAVLDKEDSIRFLRRAKDGKTGLEPESLKRSKKRAGDTISRSNDLLKSKSDGHSREFYSGAADADIKRARTNTALGVGAAGLTLALGKKLLSKKKPAPSVTKINPYAAGAAGLGTVGLGALAMDKTAENQEYEPDELPDTAPNEDKKEEEVENYSVKRNPLKRKLKKKKPKKKEPIPTRQDLEFKNPLDDEDPEDKMSEKVSSINFYTNIVNQTEKTAGRARKIRKLNRELNALLDKDNAFSKKVSDASDKLEHVRSKIKENDTFFGRLFNSSHVNALKNKELDNLANLNKVKGEAQRAADINKIERDSINTRLKMFRKGDEVGKSFRKSRDVFDNAAKEVRETYGSPIRPLKSPKSLSLLNKKKEKSLRTYERLSRAADSRPGMALPMHPKRLDKLDSRVKSSVGETNKLLGEGKKLRKQFNQQERDLFDADHSRMPKWISRRSKNQK